MNDSLTINNGFICSQEWEKRLNQKGIVIWFTGLSGAGKTTIAKGLQRRVFDEGYLCQVIDGDEIRTGINNNLGFSLQDRTENVRRVAEIAKIFANTGIITIVSLISPTESLRNLARNIIGEERFFEVFIDAPLEICEQRDVKGLYKKARNGEIKGFTGIDSPFEPVKSNVLTVNTQIFDIETSINIIRKNIFDDFSKH